MSFSCARYAFRRLSINKSTQLGDLSGPSGRYDRTCRIEGSVGIKGAGLIAIRITRGICVSRLPTPMSHREGRSFDCHPEYLVASNEDFKWTIASGEHDHVPIGEQFVVVPNRLAVTLERITTAAGHAVLVIQVLVEIVM